MIENKKAMLPFIALATAILIIVAGLFGTIAAYKFLTSKILIFNIIGGAIVALTLIYIIPKSLEGKLNRQKLGLVFGLMFLGIFIIVFANSGVLQQTTSFDMVYEPQFVSIWCDRLPFDITGSFIVNDVSESKCGFEGGNSINAYTPDGCSYTSKKNIKYKIIDINAQCPTSFLGWDRMHAYIPINVNYNKKLCLNEDQFGTVEVTYRATAYGLRLSSYDGRILFTENCNLKDNFNKIKSSGKTDVLSYIPAISSPLSNLGRDSKVDHYIIALQPVANSKNIVKLDNKQIYIIGIGEYHPIEITNDGNKVVDTLTTKSDSRLICLPSFNPLCSGGTRILPTQTGASCSSSNIPSGWVTDIDYTTKEVKYSCISGKLVKSATRNIVICSDPNKPIRDPITNTCIGGGGSSNNETNCNKIFQKEISVDQVHYQWWQLGGLIGRPTITTHKECVNQEWVIWSILGTFGLIGTLITILLLKPSKIKKKK